MSDYWKRKLRLVQIGIGGGKFLRRRRQERGPGNAARQELLGQDSIPQHAVGAALGGSETVVLPGATL